MCCFSRPVGWVSQTRIFARTFEPGVRGERQYVVYNMHITADGDVAMILPLPVAPESGEKAVEFINLENFPTFFTALNQGFPSVKYPRPQNPDPTAGGVRSTLEVQSVGRFEASYVPRVDDFERLDARFRLPRKIWDALPQYANSGFAVFQLKSGAKTFHPMAFSFPRANEKELFFPTVHIHDGEVHANAVFDHELYTQRQPGEKMRLTQWTESAQPAGAFMDLAKAQGLLRPELHCYRIYLGGQRKNEDIRLPA